MKKREIKAEAKETHEKKERKPKKEKETEEMKKIKQNYSKIVVKVKEIRPSPEQKQEMIKECLSLMNEKYEDYSKKKDGSRVLQALVKHANEETKEKLIDKLIPQFLVLM